MHPIHVQTNNTYLIAFLVECHQQPLGKRNTCKMHPIHVQTNNTYLIAFLVECHQRLGKAGLHNI